MMTDKLNGCQKISLYERDVDYVVANNFIVTVQSVKRQHGSSFKKRKW